MHQAGSCKHPNVTAVHRGLGGAAGVPLDGASAYDFAFEHFDAAEERKVGQMDSPGFARHLAHATLPTVCPVGAGDSSASVAS